MYLRWILKRSPFLFRPFVHDGLHRPHMLRVTCDIGPRLLFDSGVCSYKLCLPGCQHFHTRSRKRVGVITPLFLQAYRFADQVALIDDNGVYRYKDLMTFVELLTDRIANHLGEVSYDNMSGERVCILCPNDVSHVVAQLAVWMSGNIAVAVSPKYPPAQIEYFLTDLQCRMVITTEDLVDKVQPVVSKLGVILLLLSKTDYCITDTKVQSDNKSTADKCIDDKLLLQKERHSKRLNRLHQLRDANRFKNKQAFIFYTSGTTGSPKVSIYI